MKILMIANFVNFPWEGGNSRFTYILNNLDCKKNNVELITSNFWHGTKKHRSLDTVPKTQYKITLLDEPGYTKNISIKRFYSHYILSRNLQKYLKSTSKPDVIYCAVPSLDIAKEAAKYAKKNNIRFIIDIQDLWPEAFKMVFKIPIIKDIIFFPLTLTANYIYKNATDIVAVSETYVNRATKVNKQYKTKLSVYLGTDLNNFDKYAKNTTTPKNEEITLVYIGTLGHSYNIKDTIKAIKILNEEGINNIKLMIMGDGPLKKEFVEYAKRLNINVTFTGKLPYEQMIPELCKCDIAINPIMNGSAGSIINKVGDYAAAGLPVVNTQEALEYRKLVDTNNIGLNAENNPASIAEAFKTLIFNKTKRTTMGRNNRKLAEKRFDRQNNYKEICNLIERKRCK